MERFFYFGEATVETTGEACLFPLSSFLGATPATSGRTTLHFKSRNGAATDDQVLVHHTGTSTKDFMVYLGGLLRKNQRDTFVYVGGATTDVNLGFKAIKPVLIDTIAVTTEA